MAMICLICSSSSNIIDKSISAAEGNPSQKSLLRSTVGGIQRGLLSHASDEYHPSNFGVLLLQLCRYEGKSLRKSVIEDHIADDTYTKFDTPPPMLPIQHMASMTICIMLMNTLIPTCVITPPE